MKNRMFKAMFVTAALAVAGNAMADVGVVLECNENATVSTQDYCWHVQLKCKNTNLATLSFFLTDDFAGTALWSVPGICGGSDTFSAAKQVTHKCLAAQGGANVEFQAKAEPGDCPNL